MPPDTAQENPPPPGDSTSSLAPRRSAVSLPVAQNSGVPLVCIGMSAGGLKPLQTIFKQLSPSTGMAFMIVCHLTPTEPTELPWLLSLWSGMAADLARTGEIPQPDHIYVIPPGQEVALVDGRFEVQPKSKLHGWSNVVTLFLDSLTESVKIPCVSVILSGDDSDGKAAMQAFHDRGWITISQDLKSAGHKSMPRSAIETGHIDYVLPPDAIAPALEAIARDFNSGRSSS